MMISEFIERTGFEPTNAEYREIEAEYMGCDIDKDKFCRDWKKNGGIQRLSRQRARRIEELEAKVNYQNRQYDEMDLRRCKQFNEMRKNMQEKLDKKAAECESAVRLGEQMIAERDALQADLDRALDKLNKIREAFAILGITKEVA